MVRKSLKPEATAQEVVSPCFDELQSVAYLDTEAVDLNVGLSESGVYTYIHIYIYTYIYIYNII